jgi:mRNA-degrading endonuclease RelE of RelBE toxin-antitoxin system
VNYRVSVSHEAEKVLDRLDRPTERRIRARFIQFNSPKILSIRVSAELTDPAGLRKSSVGGWRILFTVCRDAKAIYVTTVDTRGQVCKHS